MKQLDKRLSKLEQNENSEWLTVYQAIIDDDVKVSGADIEPFTLPNEKALDEWANAKGLHDTDQIRLIKINIVHPKKDY